MILRPVSTLVTAATDEPITVEQAKLYLRVDDDADDALIGAFITAVRQWIESYTRRSLIDQVFDLAYAGFCGYGAGFYQARTPLYVPHAPLTAANKVESVKYVDADGVTQTLSTDYYRVNASTGVFAGRASIELTQAAALPAVDPSVSHPVIVRATCGYGNAAAVPKGIVSALYLMLGDMYEQRQESVAGGMGKSQLTVERLLAPYRLVEIV